MNKPALSGSEFVPSATPKPRAGERTPMTTKLIDEMLHGAGIPRCDEWDKLVRHSRALEASVYRGISDIERVEAERDLLRERERELVEALGRMVNAYDIAYQRGIVLPEDCAESKYARSVLTKVHA